MLCWQFLFPCALNWSLWRRLWILSCVRSMGRKCWECRGMTMRLLLFMMNSSHMRVPSLLHHLLRLMRSLLWITTRYVFPPPCLSYSTSTSCFVYFLVTLYNLNIVGMRYCLSFLPFFCSFPLYDTYQHMSFVRMRTGFNWSSSFMKWSSSNYCLVSVPFWKFTQPSLSGSLQHTWK